MEEREISEPLKSVHVRLSPDLHSALRVMADHEEIEISVMCERIISEAVNGKFHSLKSAALRMKRLGIVGEE